MTSLGNTAARPPSLPESGASGGGRPGMTLVELLVAMAIGLVVSGVALMIYRLNAKHYLREEAAIQQQQNLRAAFYIIGRDLRMAGNGMKVLGPDAKLVQIWTSSRQGLGPGGEASIDASDGWFKHPDSAAPGARAIFGVDGGGRSLRHRDHLQERRGEPDPSGEGGGDFRERLGSPRGPGGRGHRGRGQPGPGQPVRHLLYQKRR